MSSMKERILEALGRGEKSKTELANEFGIKLSPLDSRPISDEEDKLGRALSSLQEGKLLRVDSKKKIKEFVRVGPVGTYYSREKAENGEDPYVNFLR